MKVALKLPRPGDDQDDAEILHEVRVATRLDHPNLMGVLNASYIEDKFVIALELGEESLADRIERFPGRDSSFREAYFLTIIDHRDSPRCELKERDQFCFIKIAINSIDPASGVMVAKHKYRR